MKRLKYILTIAIALTFTAMGWSQAQQIPERVQPNKFAIKKVDFDHVKEVISNPKDGHWL